MRQGGADGRQAQGGEGRRGEGGACPGRGRYGHKNAWCVWSRARALAARSVVRQSVDDG